MRRFVPEKMKLIPAGAERKFKGEIFEVWQWPQEMFDGTVETFEMLKRDDTVGIVAILTAEEMRKLGKDVDEAKIVITYQTQPDRDWFYAFPGGRCDHPEEDELAAAKRELREETGMTFRNWKLVDARQNSSKFDWIDYVFVATGLIEQVPQKLDAGEKIEVREVSFAELKKLGQRADAEQLMIKIVRQAESLEDLENLPAIYEY